MTDEIARDIERMVLRHLAEHGQSATAEAAGVSETRLSRFKGEGNGGLDLTELARVLAVLQLRLVPSDVDGVMTIPRETFEALHVLVRDYAAGVVRRCGS